MRVPVIAVLEDPPQRPLMSCELAIAAGALDGIRTVAADLPDVFVPRGVDMQALLPVVPGTVAIADNQAHVVGTEPGVVAMDRPGASAVRVAYGECYLPSLTPLVRERAASTQRFAITGTTRDNVGAPLAGCRVVIMETGRLAAAACPVVGETVSDGAGAFSVEVAGTADYFLIAYLPGTPDRAAITLHPLTPVAIG